MSLVPRLDVGPTGPMPHMGPGPHAIEPADLPVEIVLRGYGMTSHDGQKSRHAQL